MKRTDIERMISLADDRYIDEIFQDKITGRRRNIFVTFAAVAAALILVAGGIGYLVSTAGNADKITADDPAVSELVMVDYSLYFQNKDESAMEVEGDGGVLSEATGISCYFPDSESEYVRSVMPFDMSRYVYTDCKFAYNYNDDVIGIMLHANNRTEDKQENVKMLNVEVYERGELFPHVALGKIKSMKRFDVDVYGYDFNNTIGVIFASDGKEYLVSGNYISYDEIGLIMDSLIENGLWADRFDLSKAEMEYGDISADITLEQANFIEPFAGHVPQIHKFGDMTLNFNKVSYSAGRDENNGIVPQWLYFTYYDGGDQDICLQYFTEVANIQPLEKTVAIDDIELDKLSDFRDDGNNHAFTIDFGDFKVNVWTNNCNDNELLNCIIAMRIGANGILENASREISLIEANNIVPFARYVPQVENIGDMHLVSAYCVEASFNGAVEDNTITFKYLQEETNKYITIYYTCEYDPSDNAVDFENALNVFDAFAQTSDNGSDCKKYDFTIECDGFRIKITADCAPEEMEQCLKEIARKKSKTITLAEANNIAPYSGFVPQTEKVGDMKLGLVQYNGRNIVLDYSFQSENRFSYIGLTYTIDREAVSNYAVMTIEQLTEGDIQIHRSDSDDDRHNYTFAVDCNGLFYVCIDGEKCTTTELYDCILTLLMERGQNYPVSESVTFAEAKDIEPFGVYVPSRESGSMKLEKGILNYHNKNGNKEPLSLHFTFSDSDTGDSLVFAYQKDTVDFSEMPAENIISIENIGWTAVNNFVTTKTTFLIDCGKVKLLIDADCTIDQVWYYIEQIKSAAMFDAAKRDGKLITMDKVKELAKKGDDLTWSDFESYYGVDVGSGLYIMSYAIDGTDYTVLVGGVPNEKPWYIRLGKGNGNYIDIRYDSVDEFLNEN